MANINPKGRNYIFEELYTWFVKSQCWPVIVGCVILGVLGLTFVPEDIKNRNIDFSKGTIVINNHSISTEIAETPAERQRWLTFRSEELPLNSALLLVYDKSDLYSLWLLNIQFNLDLIWLDGAGNIVYMKQDALPCKNTLDAAQCTIRIQNQQDIFWQQQRDLSIIIISRKILR